MNLGQMLHGNSKHEMVERCIILGIIIGVIIASIGIASTAIETKGMTAIMAMLGSFITFIFTVILVFYWVLREDN